MAIAWRRLNLLSRLNSEVIESRLQLLLPHLKRSSLMLRVRNQTKVDRRPTMASEGRCRLRLAPGHGHW